ncbi:MAG: zf-HC2 domain-containing protein [Anaerolineae bacterium]
MTEVLPQYVSDELGGRLDPTRQSWVRRHLADCPRCDAVYRELRYLLLAEQNGELPEPTTYPSFQLPFLHPQPAFPQLLTWTIHTMRDAQQRLSAAVAISQAYMSSLLAPPAAAWARSAPQNNTPATRYVVVDDIVEEENWVVSVELQRQSPGENETWDVLLSLAASKPTGPLRATLSYNGEAPRQALINDAGEAIFADVPPAWLTAHANESSEPLYLTIGPVDV